MRAICDIASGAVLYCDDATTPPGDGRLAIELDGDTEQAARLGLPLLWDGDETVTADLGPMKAQAIARIDREAEAFCGSFVTPGETQKMRYKRKEEVARAWLVNNSLPVPGLEIEAAGAGVSVATLVAQIIAIADQWNLIMDLVDGRRVAAKLAVEAATSVSGIESAANVNWPGLLA